MGIYDQSYRKFEGRLQGRIGRIHTIYRHEFIRRIKNKWVLALLIFTWAICVLIVFTGEPSLAKFIGYILTTFFWLLLFTSVVGGPILAEDQQYNVITLYLSRPMQRLDYFLGKYLTLFALISLIALLPNIIISVYIIGIKYDVSGEQFNYYNFSSYLIILGFLMTFVFTNIGMAISALTKNYKFAIGGIFTFLFFSNLISLVFSGLYDKIMYFSIWGNFLIIYSKWNDIMDNSFIDFDSNISFAILLIISIICIIIIWIRINRMEISE